MLIGLTDEQMGAFPSSTSTPIRGTSSVLSTINTAPPPSAGTVAPSPLTPPSSLFSTGTRSLMTAVAAPIYTQAARAALQAAAAPAPAPAPSTAVASSGIQHFNPLATPSAPAGAPPAVVAPARTFWHAAPPGETPNAMTAPNTPAPNWTAVAPTAPTGGVAPTPYGGGGGGGGLAPVGGPDPAAAAAPPAHHYLWWALGIAGVLGAAYMVSRRS